MGAVRHYDHFCGHGLVEQNTVYRGIIRIGLRYSDGLQRGAVSERGGADVADQFSQIDRFQSCAILEDIITEACHIAVYGDRGQ